jgi:nitric oxide synthase-interacting protein
MPTRHSKNAGDRHHFTYGEKKTAGIGSLKQRLGTDSQLPFGYCPLSLTPIEDAVVTPSGRIYSREAILEYLLNKTKELKQQSKAREEQQAEKALAEEKVEIESQAKKRDDFVASQGVGDIVKRQNTEKEAASSYMNSRKRTIDDTDTSTKLEQLRQVSPWIVQFTPEAAAAEIKEPPKRPPSPFSGRPLRTKDLMPVDLVKETDGDSKGSAGTKRFICPVSRKTITNQKCIFLKNTGCLMLESAAEHLAYPSMTCPLTGKPFKSSDAVEIVAAASAFASSGQVEAKRYRPTWT